MPLYDFICNTCKKEFETLVMGNSKPHCPSCGSEDLNKQMSTFAFRSTGGGTPSGSSSSGSKCGGCAGGNCSTC